MKETIYDMCDRLRMVGSEQKHSMDEPFLRIWHHEDFELSGFREMVQSLENCEEMSSRKTENRVETTG